jgi:hypothetical protein
MAKKKATQQLDIPPASKTNDQHGTLVTWVNEADEATLVSRNLSEKCRDYYDTWGQWTDAERKKLAQRKQAATISNRIKPKMDGLMGMERANRTTAKAYPRTPRHAAGATAATEAVRFVLQDNFYDQKRSAVWDNLLIEGTGGVEILVKYKGDEPKIVINHIAWDRLIYDPHSRRKDFSDARYLGQVVWMDYDEAIALYPDGADVLDSMINGSTTYDDKPRWMDTTRRRVKIVEMYWHEGTGNVKYACFTRGGYLKAPVVTPYKNEEGETEWPYEFASLFVGREGTRYGSAAQYLDIQDEINKRRSKFLHLASVRQTFGTTGAVPDVNKARQELAKPDGHLEVSFGEFGKDFGVLPTHDMAAAQFNLLTEAKMEIDAVGYNAAASGKDQRAISGVALRNRQQASQTELAPMFDVLKHLDHRVYRKIWNRVKQYWKAEKWIRVTDDENNLKWVGLNKPITKGEAFLQKAQADGLPPEMLQQMQQAIAMDPMMREKVDTQNDIAKLDVDIIMDEAPDTVTQEVEDFQAMAEMVKSGFPLPPEAVIMASPLSNKDRIIKMMKEQQQQPQMSPEMQKQHEQMAEQIKRLTEENQKLRLGEQERIVKTYAQREESLADADFQRWKARLDAETEKDVAMIKAGATVQSAKIAADARPDTSNANSE